MSEFAISPSGIPLHLEESAGTTARVPQGALILIVGFDGSRAAQRALDAAVQIVYQRQGRLEIVYVSEEAAVSASPKLTTEGDGFANGTAKQLSFTVRTLLEQREQRWRFHHRNGETLGQLVAAADEVRDQSDAHSGNTIVIVVGNDRRTAGSVTTRLLRESPYPLVLVP
jgi:nucleotide-binding universal stress UspA family protein